MDILATLDYNIKNFSEMLGHKKVYESEIERRETEVQQYLDRIKFLKGTKELYLQAVDLMYQESVGVLQDTLDTALHYVMRDKDYSVKLEMEDKRGVKTLNLAFTDNEEGFDTDMEDGTGMGVRAIVSFVLKAYYLTNENSKVLMLDEKYSFISDEYLPYFMEFVKKFTEERGFIIIMITHDPRFMAYGDKVYTVADGVISEEKLDGEDDSISVD